MHKRLWILMAAFVLATGLEAAPLRLGGRTYKDETNGFRLKVPDKWEQVPTPFQETLVVGKWGGRAKKARFQTGLQVYRFLAKKETTPSEGDVPEGAPRGIPGFGRFFAPRWNSFFEMIETRFGRQFDLKEKNEAFKGAKDHKIELRIYEGKLAGGARPGRQVDVFRGFLVCASIRGIADPDTEFGVLYSCGMADAPDMKRAFLRSIKTFRVLDPEAEDTEDGITDEDIFVNSEEKPDAWRAARKKKLIPGWDALDTKNYLIVFNKKVRPELIRKVAKHIEAIRAQIYQHLFPPAQEIKAISVVRVCKDRAEYMRYGGAGGSAGYWSPMHEELVFFQDKSRKGDALRVLYHEAFHQYIHYAVGKVAPHSWFNEGHGDYFSGHNYRNRKFHPAPFAWRTGIISNAVRQKTYVPLPQFLKYTQGQYYANPGLCYAQGWSFVYFLREAERRKMKKYKKYWGLLDKYFAAVKKNVKSARTGSPFPGAPVPPGGEEIPGLGEDLPEPGTDGTEPEEDAGPRLPLAPGLEKPFPGEHPEAGAAGADRGMVETPPARPGGMRGALDAAVDEAFAGVDLAQLEKDWVEFIK